MKSQQALEEDLLPKDTQRKKSSQASPTLTEKQKSAKQEYFNNKHYIFGTNAIQKLFYTWVSPLLKYGYNVDVDEKAIPQLQEHHQSKVDFNRFVSMFQKSTNSNKSKIEGLTLTKTIFKTFKKEFAIVYFLGFFITGISMYQPILSHDVINYIASQNKTIKIGLLYFFIIFLISLLQAINQTYFWYCFEVIGFNLSNSLRLMIYNKALKHPLLTQKQYPATTIINFSQVDAQRLTQMGYQMGALIYTPVQIIIALILLYLYIGISFLVGLGVMILLMCFTLFFSKIATTYNDELLKAKDIRMKVTEQFLQIIKFIKINALEKYYFQKINRKRQAELKLIKKANLCNVACIFIFWLCPPTIVSFTFLAYIGMGNEISAAKAFFTIIIFNTLQYPIRVLPTAISELIQIWSSVKRLQKFFNACELNQGCIEQNSENNQKFAIQISRGNFLWGKQKENQSDEKKKQVDKNDSHKSNGQINEDNKTTKRIQDIKNTSQTQETMSEDKLKQSLISESDKSFIQKQIQDTENKEKKSQKYVKCLFDINLKFLSKEVTMIIGDIGSGKSSLLYAILNQMTPESEKNPKIIINGSIAYSPQKAWIMAGTVKQNILFCQPFDEQRFKDAIYYSCLTDDLKILPKGIDTDIGEKGINLSGGQKARISLARALYSNKDIYLLDDILSAVDVHVGKFLMQKTILQYLRNKTVIMPTHAVKYLQKADNILIMKKGAIIANGKYQQVNDLEQFQQIIKLECKKEEQKQQQQSKKEQQVLNQLKLVREATLSKEKQKQQKETSYTNKIVDQLIIEEDHHKGEVELAVYLEYIKLNGGPLFVIVVVFCMSSWVVLSILSNIQVEKWCQDESKDKIHLYLFLSFGISATIFSGLRAFILITSGIKQGRTLHKKAIKALLYASINQFYNRVPIGRILNRLSKDLREIDQSIGYAVGSCLICFFSMIASLTMCLYASTPLILIPMLAVSLLCRWTLRYYLKTQRQCVRIENITNSPIVSGFTSSINGIATIRAYGLPSQFLTRQMNLVDTNKRMRITKNALECWFALRLAIFSFIINMSALAYSIFNNNNNASLIGLLLTYCGLLNDDIIGFAFSYASMELKMIGVQRVNTFTKLEPEPAYIQYCKKWRTKEEGSNLNAIKQGDIKFEKYCARYRQGLPLVIKGITLSIEHGEKVGIVGRTGAGKSTLINCLLRILEAAEGRILIDQKDIRQYPLKDLRSCITMIEQEPTLMNGSFRDNLDPANQYTDKQIHDILRQCNLAEMVQTKGGLDAKVTNDNLSVGQKQLLCICRAFLKHSKIILIDEATANIDIKNDKLIQNVIASAFKECTVLTIAHRLSTLQNCDKILVLGGGKVLEWGSIQELMKKPDGIYRKMWEENDSSFLH